ncbi:hypothetical protein [Mucilaginibacter aquaedulcis]|uniref:hypothetical protein n=1 Tax=Mucilaginibacter aquaedulcis TaxID=1187081 RepID=UPI0025B4B521|nr:hypothetical protein [Mucilaginibacter aquaedulcis]MDN3551162.1 hypothetical protein [Mucilaginibacter aquaedulcis]
MQEENWNQEYAKSVGLFLNGKGLNATDSDGNPVVDDNFFIMFNAHDQDVDFRLPEKAYGKQWIKVIDTEKPDKKQEKFEASDMCSVPARSLYVFQAKN